MTDPWNPAQYDKFKREREQPFFDLMAMVRPAPAMHIVDLGCGTGALTRQLHARLAARQTLGLDQSSKMLADARASELPAGLAFEVGDIAAFAADQAYDLIFSNAAFHWLEHHDQLIARLVAALKPGGQLLFQVPAMHDDPSHTAAEALTTVEPFAHAFGGWHRPQPVLSVDAYAQLLYRNGLTEPSVRLIVYPHVLESAESVIEWMKGTLLTEYARHLPAEMFPAFVQAYRDRVLAALDDTTPFFYPFKRILCWGQKR
ncbi:MAG TPA: methyltransferase domain-containing protein [Vicinamibacterales bacterium]|nr:methyltransferase domain-containing protein [Vicinamibacterales bacterium]